jgi:hypothetical protein
MNSELNNFFKEEQKRVHEPGPYFAQRVMAHLASARERLAPTVWEALPNAMRPLISVALILLFAVLTIQILLPPVEPARGAFEAYVKQDLSPREQLLLADAPEGTSAAQIEELIVLEPLQ